MEFHYLTLSRQLFQTYQNSNPVPETKKLKTQLKNSSIFTKKHDITETKSESLCYVFLLL